MKEQKNKGTMGFTLVELMLVIAISAILLGIVIVAINPARQFSQANNSQRRTDINTILNAINQYQDDNRGSLPAFIPSTSTQQIGDSTGNCVITTCGATTTTAVCLNLSSALAPTYIVSMPYDPLQTNASSTRYAITKSATNNRLTITACDAELSESISVAR